FQVPKKFVENSWLNPHHNPTPHPQKFPGGLSSSSAGEHSLGFSLQALAPLCVLSFQTSSMNPLKRLRPAAPRSTPWVFPHVGQKSSGYGSFAREKGSMRYGRGARISGARRTGSKRRTARSEEHTSELQSR